MAIVAKAPATNFVPAPAGAHSAVCVDVVDLGMLEVAFGGKKKKQHKVRVVWQIAEVMPDNRPYVVQKRYTLSLHEKAALRKDLESWRGKAFTEDELQGFDLEVLIGIPCLLNVLQQAKDGTMYSNITSIMRLPKGMEQVKPRDYVRVVDRTPETDSPPEAPEQGDWQITDDDVPF